MKAYIYAVIDPRINKVFYVGQTKNPENRFKSHKNHIKTPIHLVDIVENQIIDAGYTPVCIVIEEVDYKDRMNVEKYWTFKYKREGHPLTNIAYGNSLYGKDNPFFNKRHSKETIKLIIESNKGKHNGENNAFYGKKHSKEARYKISNAHKDKHNGENNLMHRSNGIRMWITNGTENHLILKTEFKLDKYKHYKPGQTRFRGWRHSEETKRRISNTVKMTKSRKSTNL